MVYLVDVVWRDRVVLVVVSDNDDEDWLGDDLGCISDNDGDDTGVVELEY